MSTSTVVYAWGAVLLALTIWATIALRIGVIGFSSSPAAGAEAGGGTEAGAGADHGAAAGRGRPRRAPAVAAGGCRDGGRGWDDGGGGRRSGGRRGGDGLPCAVDDRDLGIVGDRLALLHQG